MKPGRFPGDRFFAEVMVDADPAARDRIAAHVHASIQRTGLPALWADVRRHEGRASPPTSEQEYGVRVEVGSDQALRESTWLSILADIARELEDAGFVVRVIPF